jgi:kinesin family protein 5
LHSQKEMIKLLEAGITNRAIGSTQMNATSSRSHCVSLLAFQQIDAESYSVRTGKLHLVDLAGSEKLEKRRVNGALLEEAKMIKKSLSALGKVSDSLT